MFKILQGLISHSVNAAVTTPKATSHLSSCNSEMQSNGDFLARMFAPDSSHLLCREMLQLHHIHRTCLVHSKALDDNA